MNERAPRFGRAPQQPQKEKKELKRERETRSGRDFETVRTTPERFSILEEGKDYTLRLVNPAVSGGDLAKQFLFLNRTGGSETRMVFPPHWRAISSPSDEDIRVTVETEGGAARVEPFFEANTKGVGYLKPTARGASPEEDYDTWIAKDDTGQQRFGYKMLGIAPRWEFEDESNIIDKSMSLQCEGIRSEVYWAIADAQQVIFQGEKISVDELQRKGVLSKREDNRPVLVVRLFKNNSRVEEVYRNEKDRDMLFDKAFETYNREARFTDPQARQLRRGSIEDERQFFSTFAERMGTNIAGFFNSGKHSLYLHASNITLAAEIADIGTVVHWSEEEGEGKKSFVRAVGGVRTGHLKDLRDVLYSLRFIAQAARDVNLHTGNREALKEAFMRGYESAVVPERLAKENTDPERAHRWVEAVARAVLVDRMKLPPLAHYEVEDWPISVE